MGQAICTLVNLQLYIEMSKSVKMSYGVAGVPPCKGAQTQWIDLGRIRQFPWDLMCMWPPDCPTIVDVKMKEGSGILEVNWDACICQRSLSVAYSPHPIKINLCLWPSQMYVGVRRNHNYCI